VRFAQALTAARNKSKLTRYDLAGLSGVSYKHIANLEAGKRPPSLPVVTKLHGCLRFPQRVLLGLFEDCHGDNDPGG
jgi:transcriptional regulator with XRE-family HTH domain